jgi:ribosomal protein S14
MNNLLKKNSFYHDNIVRKNFSNNEIFQDCFLILDQTNFSKNLKYFSFKQNYKISFYTKIKNRCVVTGYTRSVNSKLKLSRIILSRKILNGNVTGYYRSV